MLNLEHIATALHQYKRYGLLDTFVNDVDEFRDRSILTNEGIKLVRAESPPRWHLPLGESWLAASLFVQQGIARFRFTKSSETTVAGIQLTEEQLLKLEIDLMAATESAVRAKQGLTGTVVVAMMVGNHVGTPAGPVGQRVLTIQFDPANNKWHAYDGQLLSWAKRHFALAVS